MFELFVSPNYVKKHTALSGSVDDALIMPYILMAQQKFILPVLGESLYKALEQKVSDDTVTGDYETLMETYIQLALAHYSFATLMPFLRLRFVNSAIVAMNSEQSNGASYAELKPVMNDTLALANFLRGRLVEHLCNNGTQLYSEFDKETAEQLSPSSRNYTQGLNIYPTSNLEIRGFLAAIGAKAWL